MSALDCCGSTGMSCSLSQSILGNHESTRVGIRLYPFSLVVKPPGGRPFSLHSSWSPTRLFSKAMLMDLQYVVFLPESGVASLHPPLVSSGIEQTSTSAHVSRSDALLDISNSQMHNTPPASVTRQVHSSPFCW